MRVSPLRSFLLVASLTAFGSIADAQSLVSLSPEMHWRHIGPYRGGRGRAATGIPSQPNVFYITYDNGGVWRSTDFGSSWVPLFDDQSTGSIGAIAAAPSNPNILYVGSGAGIIRPDLATGDGMYKTTDAGKTWTHLGLRDTEMIGYVDVDPKNPDRLFVAALGHPYGPNAERGIFRSTDGGQTFDKVLYKDEYTSANDVRIDPSNPNTVYAALWQQQQSFIEGQGFGGAGGGVYKSTDGGTTWKQLTDGLTNVIEANLAIAPSNPKVLYATVAVATLTNSVTGTVNLYKSTDAGEHWIQVTPQAPRTADQRPLARIGGGDLPTIIVDPKNENVIYTASTVMWRSEDGGLTWSAVRGSPGGDDYQRIWINPNDPNILLVISDQGGTVSSNRGLSWSSWYTQPTAAMYHVSTDKAFPYRVCSGQQDSGSACVESWSPDGEITFHDWHPVNIQEYGVAAADPDDPDKVYASARTNVSLYDRKTSQTAFIGPDMTVKGPNGESYNRNVRTMPITWSLDSKTMYYASNAVWKTTNGGRTWTRISPDLARQTWGVPTNTGKYGATVKPAPLGAITALSPSPRDVKIIWAGTDDGNVQMTMDGGAKWNNVTPAAIKPWTRIFNIEAGHFDAGTAYAAANTMRVDDRSPHFWRTHDGGKSWTEINTGIPHGAVSNSIREDPKVKGLLYGSTDTQVWVSYDDGDNWQSLRINMPAISVRDLQLKDDATCMCSDLIAGTHGRGFWILDDVSPLRAMATTRDAHAAYLVKPQTAVRMRFANNDPTPWPPEVPAGENPPAGAILNYFLRANAKAVKLEIMDAAGKVVRAYSSTDSVLAPDPALEPEAYNRVCQRNPNAPHCSVPLYWAAPNIALSSAAGMHRFIWDMRYDPIQGMTSENEANAVPHRTYFAAIAPFAAPGSYTVRLVADGTTSTQPINVVLDPRVKTTVTAMKQVSALSREMYDNAAAAHAAYDEARKMSEGSSDAALKALVDSIAPPASAAPRRGFGGPPQPVAANLQSVQGTLIAAAMSLQAADVAPTARQIDAVEKARAQYKDVITKWKTLAARKM